MCFRKPSKYRKKEWRGHEKQVVLPQICMERIMNYSYPQRQKAIFRQAFGFREPWGCFENSSKPVWTYYSWKTLTLLRHITSHMRGHKYLPLFFYTEMQHWDSISQIAYCPDTAFSLEWSGASYLHPSVCLSLLLVFPFSIGIRLSVKKYHHTWG